jgi:hypothetical protein
MQLHSLQKWTTFLTTLQLDSLSLLYWCCCNCCYFFLSNDEDVEKSNKAQMKAIYHFDPIWIWSQWWKHIIWVQSLVNFLHVLILTILSDNVSFGLKWYGIKVIYCPIVYKHDVCVQKRRLLQCEMRIIRYENTKLHFVVSLF